MGIPNIYRIARVRVLFRKLRNTEEYEEETERERENCHVRQRRRHFQEGNDQ